MGIDNRRRKIYNEFCSRPPLRTAHNLVGAQGLQGARVPSGRVGHCVGFQVQPARVVSCWQDSSAQASRDGPDEGLGSKGTVQDRGRETTARNNTGGKPNDVTTLWARVRAR